MNKLFTLLAVLTCATIAWATNYNVKNDSELRAAIADDGANITVTEDIDLSNSTLEIKANTTVTLNLGGHTLDRKLTKRGEGGGQVITVRSGAKLNLSNGTLQGGWGGAGGALVNEGGTVTLTDVTCSNNVADDRGGGICNREGGTLTMTDSSITNNLSYDKSGAKGGGGLFNEEGSTAVLAGVTIMGNKAKLTDGGGICNFGTLTVDGCTIQNNKANTEGGGIWTENGKTLNMKGAMTVTDNTTANGLTNNLFLRTGALITVTGSLTGSNVGITMEKAGVFTSGYNTHNSSIDPATVFKADLSGAMAVSLDGNEAKLANSLPEGTVYFIERSWDEENKCVKADVKTLASGEYTVLQGSDDPVTIQPGYYVVKGDIECERVYCEGGGKHHLILCDGAKLSTYFVRVEDDNELYIYGQTNDLGKLVVGDEKIMENHAGIGGDGSKTVGTIVIHGGDINTYGSPGGAGIGCGYEGKDATIVIYGGNIYAKGNDNSVASVYENSSVAGAGIGGGDMKDGSITIYGGDISATGGYGAAGIGSGCYNLYAFNGGAITIYGGDISATGGGRGAGIGSGEDCNGAYVTIHGGIVKAWGESNGPGIGTGFNYKDKPIFNGELTVTGGEVYAYGSEDHQDASAGGGGAGIGGGRNADGSKVTISGGYVYAQGGDYAAGIGSGCEAFFSGGKQGGSLTVTGGRVYAYGGVDAAGIGGGEDAEGATVNVSGGYVYAEGNDYGAGIGGGEGGDGGKVTITGGTVIAKKGENAARAIGSGDGDNNGSLTFGDDRCVYITTNLWRCKKENRVSDCWVAAYVQISECLHGDATASIVDGEKHDISSCKWCYVTGEEAHTFRDYGECDACHLISLADDADNSESISHWAEENGSHSVVLSGRTLKKGAWNTLCLPFNATTSGPLAGATIKELDVEDKWIIDNGQLIIDNVNGTRQTGFDSETGTLNLYFKDANSIEAGKPYIVKWETSQENITDPVFNNVTLSNTLNPVETTAAEGVTVTFAGAYSPMFIGLERKNMLYLGPDNTLYYPSQAMTIGSCRAHFRLEGITAGDINNTRMYFGEEDDNETTIENVQCSMFNVQSENIYNLSGQRLSKPQKGINIINGKKILF